MPGAALVRADVAGAPEDVTNRTSTVRPRRCWSAARTWGRNLLSSHSRANALGTPMRKTSSSSEMTCVSTAMLVCTHRRFLIVLFQREKGLDLEAHLSTEDPPTCARTWISLAHEDDRRSSCARR